LGNSKGAGIFTINNNLIGGMGKESKKDCMGAPLNFFAWEPRVRQAKLGSISWSQTNSGSLGQAPGTGDT